MEGAAKSFGEGVAFADCPGFLDNRGFEINVANVVNVKQTIAAAESVVVVVIINYHSLLADRGKGVRDLVNILCGLFGAPPLSLPSASPQPPLSLPSASPQPCPCHSCQAPCLAVLLEVCSALASPKMSAVMDACRHARECARACRIGAARDQPGARRSSRERRANDARDASVEASRPFGAG